MKNNIKMFIKDFKVIDTNNIEVDEKSIRYFETITLLGKIKFFIFKLFNKRSIDDI